MAIVFKGNGYHILKISTNYFGVNSMVFGSIVTSTTSTPFVSGNVVNVKHVYDAVSTNENSEHLASITTALQCVSGKSAEDLISKNQREKPQIL